MWHPSSRLLIPAVALMCCCASQARDRTVAMTFDDLPWAAGDAHPAPLANRKILAALARHRVPTTGFVIQKRVELGAPGTQILRLWTRQGFNLGNHTWSHPDFNDLTIDQMESEILRGEADRKPRFFRFPFNHTGDTQEKHDAIAAFLGGRGYKTAPCTIDNSDWMFNIPYLLMLSRHDTAAAAKLRSDYIAYTGVEIDYYSGLNKKVLGYEPPHIMLLHDNQLNADVIEDVLTLFASRHYRFVSLTEAEADPVYQAPETFFTKFGWMWGYRSAAERGIKVNGKLETEPPQWLSKYADAGSGGRSSQAH